MSYNMDPLAYKGLVHPQWMDDRPLLVSRRRRRHPRHHLHAGRSRQGHPRARVRSGRARRRALLCLERRDQERSPAPQAHRHQPHRPRHPSRWSASAATRSSSAAPLEPPPPPTPAPRCFPPSHEPLTLSPDKKLGAFIRDWNLWVRDLATGKETQLTTDGVQGLRLRHRQRRLEAHRQRHPALVARLEEDRHLPAGPAQDRRDVPGPRHQRPSQAAGVEVSAGRRQGRHHDRARHHRRGHAQGHAPQDASRPAPVDPVRRHRLRRRPPGTTSSGAPTTRISPSSPPRAITSRSGCASPTPPPARSAR